jgi:hypothetical protein
VLSELDPAKYGFDLDAPLALRRHDILTIKNAWRQAHNLPPIPAPKSIAAVPQKTVRPLLDRFLTGNADERRQAQADIEKLGPGASFAVLKRRIEADKKEDEKRLDELLPRIACIVTQIEFADRSLKPDAALSKKLEELKGKPFEPKRFLQVIGATLKAPPPGMLGLRIDAERIGDGTGFTVRFDLLDQARAGVNANAKGLPTWVDKNEHICVGNDGVHNESGSIRFSIWTEDHNSQLARVLDDVLASAPELSIDISLELKLKWVE